MFFPSGLVLASDRIESRSKRLLFNLNDDKDISVYGTVSVAANAAVKNGIK